MCQLMYQETGVVVTKMRVDGGVCRNDFLMQLISDLTMVTIDRPTFIETASHGAAMMAGLSFGTSMLTESQKKEIIWISFQYFRDMEVEEWITGNATDGACLLPCWKSMVKWGKQKYIYKNFIIMCINFDIFIFDPQAGLCSSLQFVEKCRPKTL